MSFERTSGGMPAEPVPPSTSATGGGSDAVTPALRMQILASEHWSLLATRSLGWNEQFSRAGMFLSTLSGVIVALALVGQGSDFGEAFVIFAIVILPIALFVGVTTLVRMGASNYSEGLCVVGMNRIRAGYLEMAPDLERFLVMSPYDDFEGMEQTMGFQPGGSRVLSFLAASASVVAILNAAIVGVLGALIGLQLGFGTPLIVLLGVVGFIATNAAQGMYAARIIGRARAEHRPRFPRSSTPDAQAKASRTGM